MHGTEIIFHYKVDQENSNLAIRPVYSPCGKLLLFTTVGLHSSNGLVIHGIKLTNQGKKCYADVRLKQPKDQNGFLPKGKHVQPAKNSCLHEQSCKPPVNNPVLLCRLHNSWIRIRIGTRSRFRFKFRFKFKFRMNQRNICLAVVQTACKQSSVLMISLSLKEKYSKYWKYLTNTICVNSNEGVEVTYCEIYCG